jgi:hypothetical protein
VARLLGEGRDVNEADETGCTALICAAGLPARADVVAAGPSVAALARMLR